MIVLDDLYNALNSLDPLERSKARWRVGRGAYDEIGQIAAPPLYDKEAFDDAPLGARAEARYRTLSRKWERKDWLKRHAEGWGKECHLLGLPVVCDPDFKGIRLEPGED